MTDTDPRSKPDRDAPTIVLFRKWRMQPHDIIALFPCEPGTNDPLTCNSYVHVGQHGSANLAHVMNATRRATSEEYTSLKRELESAPYEYVLDVRARTPRAAASIRRNSLERTKP